MKKFFAAAVIFFSAGAYAETGKIHCDYSRNEPIESFSEVIPLDQSWSKSIESEDGHAVKLTLNYSATLHTLEASIEDKTLGVSASSGDWFREESIGAGAIVKLSIKDRTYMLSCGLL
jgi:hypothetical protein